MSYAEEQQMDNSLYESDRDRSLNPWSAHPTNICYVGTHFHYMLEIIYALESGFCVNVDNEWFTLNAGDYIFINSGVQHATTDERGLARYVVSIPKSVLIPELQIMDQSYCIFSDDEERTMQNMLSCLYKNTIDTNMTASVAKRTFLTLIANSIVSYIIMKKSDLSCHLGCSDPFFEMIDYICNNYRDPELNTASLSRRFGYTSRMLSDMFMTNLKIGVKKYIDILRVNDAKSMLVTTTLNVESIAQEVGYDCLRTFYRIFSAHTGQTPSEFREINGIAGSIEQKPDIYK